MKIRYITLSMIILNTLAVSCSEKRNNADQKEVTGNNINAGKIQKHEIKVDGEVSDWEAIPAVTVARQEQLWLGEGLPEGQWKGPEDLSFSWKSTWNDGKLYFLFEVKDDTLSNFDQEYAWLNDCIEIYVDPGRKGGSRIEGIGPENTLEDRTGRKMRGYEMQFLPSNPPKVYADDSKGVYFTDAEQNDLFNQQWNGEVARKKTNEGYLMEIGFVVPDTDLQSGEELGLDVAVCDDDGDGRKSLLLWSGYKGEFWLTMDNFKGITLE
jgi:hypothetical protein